ncbi:MAG: hypothetical protein K0B06_11555 [Brevefilum sp.]|nr:hypothetical protein [Brevefilum sp.]
MIPLRAAHFAKRSLSRAAALQPLTLRSRGEGEVQPSQHPLTLQKAHRPTFLTTTSGSTCSLHWV